MCRLCSSCRKRRWNFINFSCFLFWECNNNVSQVTYSLTTVACIDLAAGSNFSWKRCSPTLEHDRCSMPFVLLSVYVATCISAHNAVKENGTQKNDPRKMIPGKNGPWKNGTRKNDPREKWPPEKWSPGKIYHLRV